ncbi:MAG: hypothetical protein CMH83_08110 [Nocardioides sp.]|nr:hypothetical protein [Nocardioides sp.]
MTSRTSLLLAVGFVVLWSSGFVGATLAADAGAVAGLLAWRYLATAALLLVPLAPRLLRLTRRQLGEQAVLGVLSHVVFLGGVFGAAAAGIDAGTVALVAALQPMLVTAAGVALWHDRVRAVQLVGLLLGLVAVAVTVGGADVVGLAVALPVLSLLGLSGGALLERHWQPGVDIATSLAVQVSVAAVLFTAYAATTGALLTVRPGTDVAVAIIWLVVFSCLGGYATFVACLRRFGATRTSTLLYLTPPVTTMWGWVMFADAPSSTQWLGLAIGAAAVGLAAAGGHTGRSVRPPGVPVRAATD